MSALIFSNFDILMLHLQMYWFRIRKLYPNNHSLLHLVLLFENQQNLLKTLLFQHSLAGTKIQTMSPPWVVSLKMHKITRKEKRNNTWIRIYLTSCEINVAIWFEWFFVWSCFNTIVIYFIIILFILAQVRVHKVGWNQQQNGAEIHFEIFLYLAISKQSDHCLNNDPGYKEIIGILKSPSLISQQPWNIQIYCWMRNFITEPTLVYLVWCCKQSLHYSKLNKCSDTLWLYLL